MTALSVALAMSHSPDRSSSHAAAAPDSPSLAATPAAPQSSPVPSESVPPTLSVGSSSATPSPLSQFTSAVIPVSLASRPSPIKALIALDPLASATVAQPAEPRPVATPDSHDDSSPTPPLHGPVEPTSLTPTIQSLSLQHAWASDLVLDSTKQAEHTTNLHIVDAIRDAPHAGMDTHSNVSIQHHPGTRHAADEFKVQPYSHSTSPHSTNSRLSGEHGGRSSVGSSNAPSCMRPNSSDPIRDRDRPDSSRSCSSLLDYPEAIFRAFHRESCLRDPSASSSGVDDDDSDACADDSTLLPPNMVSLIMHDANVVPRASRSDATTEHELFNLDDPAVDSNVRSSVHTPFSSIDDVEQSKRADVGPGGASSMIAPQRTLGRSCETALPAPWIGTTGGLVSASKFVAPVIPLSMRPFFRCIEKVNAVMVRRCQPVLSANGRSATDPFSFLPATMIRTIGYLTPGETIVMVRDANGGPKLLQCTCGSVQCEYRLQCECADMACPWPNSIHVGTLPYFNQAIPMDSVDHPRHQARNK